MVSWHTEYFIDMARIAHRVGMRRKKTGRIADSHQSFGERNLYLNLARGDQHK